MTDNSGFHVTNQNVKSVPVYSLMNVLWFKNSSFNVRVQYSIYVFGMLSLGCIVISDLVVTDLFMHSHSGMILAGMILLCYLAAPFFTLNMFLHEIIITHI